MCLVPVGDVLFRTQTSTCLMSNFANFRRRSRRRCARIVSTETIRVRGTAGHNFQPTQLAIETLRFFR